MTAQHVLDALSDAGQLHSAALECWTFPGWLSSHTTHLGWRGSSGVLVAAHNGRVAAGLMNRDRGAFGSAAYDFARAAARAAFDAVPSLGGPVVRCAWCGIHLSGHDDSGPISHGICKPCVAKVRG